jgi:hypothetical protein
VRPVARGIAGGLLLSLVVVAGLALLSGAGQFGGSNPGRQFEGFISNKQSDYVTSATTSTATVSSTTTAFATTAVPPAQAAAQSAATISSAQPKPSYSVLLAYLPIAAALALGASAYLISRSRIEKEA